MPSLIKAVAKGLTTTVIFFLLVEVALRGAYAARNAMVEYVPLPYAFGDDYGPTPPWLDRLEILRNDPLLIWRNEPNARRTYLDIYSPVRTEDDRRALLRQFSPRLPAEFRGNHIWHMQLNSEGFRSGELARPLDPRAIRILCVGDSWTFGMPVNQDETYPSRLDAWLRQEHPEQRYEVDNLGVLGYTTFQGLQLMQSRALDLHPNIVVIGFGMNDSNVAGYRDRDMVGGSSSLGGRVKSALKDAVEGLEDYKLLKYEALLLRFRPKSVGEYIKQQAETKGSGPVDYESIEPWTRVSPRDYESNLREMIRQANGVGAKVILLDNELWEGSPYRPVLKRISAELRVPLVDSLSLIASERQKIERDLETQLRLTPIEVGDVSPPAVGDETTVVFRVFRGASQVSKWLSIVGTGSKLGSNVPNTIAMHDDGTGGDQRAGDGVWSYAVSLPAGKPAFYIYTNSGTPGQWDGLDLPHIRRVDVPAFVAHPVYLPIETFGRVYMQGDDWHTDKVGYDLIAHAVAREVVALH